MAVWLAAPVYWLRDHGAESITGTWKRTRRLAHRAWYESGKAWSRFFKRARKSMSRGVLQAGVTAKRAVRRER
jgi:hypothetical protein